MDDGVEAADPACLIAHLVYPPQDRLLVRDRHVRAQHVLAPHALERRGEVVVGNLARLVAVRESEGSERRVVHRRR